LRKGSRQVPRAEGFGRPGSRRAVSSSRQARRAHRRTGEETMIRGAKVLRARVPGASVLGALLLGALLLGATLVAQQAPDRSHPPQAGPPPALKLPAIQKQKLSNGVPVWV